MISEQSPKMDQDNGRVHSRHHGPRPAQPAQSSLHTQLSCDSSFPKTSNEEYKHNYLSCQKSRTAKTTKTDSGQSMRDAKQIDKLKPTMSLMPTLDHDDHTLAANRIEPCNAPCDCLYYSLVRTPPSALSSPLSLQWFRNMSLSAKQSMPSMSRAVRSITTPLKFVLFILLICHCHHLAQ